MLIISHLRVSKLVETVERKLLCLLPCTFLAKAVVYANDLGLDPRLIPWLRLDLWESSSISGSSYALKRIVVQLKFNVSWDLYLGNTIFYFRWIRRKNFKKQNLLRLKEVSKIPMKTKMRYNQATIAVRLIHNQT